MIPFGLASGQGEPLTLLALSAHCDDIEIGAGGTLLRLAREVPGLRAHVVVFTSTPQRAAEARASAAAYLAPASIEIEVHDLPDGHLPSHWDAAKDILETTARAVDPQLILAPGPADAHQDHRVVGGLVRTVFRDHLVLHYELPKWDGDLGADRPSHYVRLDEELMRQKIELLREYYPSQCSRDWFVEETFFALARLRGMEVRARYAEAFSVPKAELTLGSTFQGRAQVEI